MVEVFKTNVQNEEISNLVIRKLLEHFPESKINFDLEDCDKILRIEYNTVNHQYVTEILRQMDIRCEVLED